MGQPVKLSDALVLDARVMGDALDRSIAGQIEFWANLGRAIEPLLSGDTALTLAQRGRAKPLSDCLRTASSPAGRKRVVEYLKTQPYPHYESVAGLPGLLVRIEADGTRMTGRFVNRTFQPITTGKK